MAYVKRGQKELRKDWPVVSGTDADQKHEGRQVNLRTRGKLGIHSRVPSRAKAGIDEGRTKR